ncbi:hypothetical protein ACFMQL_11355 [Nonomuraea fastidiosa]|uniref:hypothetical protein n=1 Tax=Nonomuraea TaxID=83681 RepID=UPI003245DDDD
MRLGWDALHGYDWSRLSHAYGRAVDTRGHLMRLRKNDEAGWVEAIEHLFESVVHQSSIYSATAPAALVVAGLLEDPRFDRPISIFGWSTEPVRAHLLGFLHAVAEGTEPDRTESELWQAYCTICDRDTSGGEDKELDTEDYDAIIHCRVVAPVLVDPVLRCVSHKELQTRVQAADAAAMLCQVPTVANRRTEIITLLESRARDADTYYERAKALFALDRLGAVNRAFLFDHDTRIRVRAAFASNLADDPDGTQVILDAIANPDHIAGWYPDSDLQTLPDDYPDRLIIEAIRRVPDFAELLPTALAVASRSSRSTGYPDWSMLLQAAFPTPFSTTGSLNDAQRAYLQALLENDEIWNLSPVETFGLPPDMLFALLGLPYDRQLLSAIVNTGS